MIIKHFSSRLLLVFTFLFAVQAFSQQDGPVTYRISGISTEGNKFYDSKTIIANSGLLVGQEIQIPSDETHEAIMRLWNLKLFSNIELKVGKKTGNNAELIIKVEEFPRLDKVRYTGNDEFSDKDLEEKISLSQGQVLTPQTIKDIEYNIQKAYYEEGYPQAEVKVDQLVNTFNEAQLRVKIDEGKHVVIKRISFEGNLGKLSQSDLRGAMEETSEDAWYKIFGRPRFKRVDFEIDKRYIIGYAQEHGYKDAAIVEEKISYSTDKEDMYIKLKMNVGPQYRINSVKFTGYTDKLLNKDVNKDSLFKARLDMKPGDIYNMKKFNQNLNGNEDETDVAALYLDNGYLGFRAEVSEKDAGNNRVDLTVNITENRQYRIGMINFEGNQKTQDKVIRRELYTIPGMYFNRTSMKRSMINLSSLNYFNPEKLNYDFNQRNDSTVDLIYKMEERSSDQLNASVGYSQSYGLSGSLGLTFNNFDILDPLSGGAGQQLTFQWDFGSSGTYRTFTLGFTEPWFLNTPTSLGVSLFDSKQNYTYSLRETGGQLNVGRRFRFPDDYFRGDWFFKAQRTEVLFGAGLYEEGTRTQLSIGQVISRNSTNNPTFPSLGSRLSISSELAGANLIGSINFFKQGFKAEAFNSLDNLGRLVLYSSFNFEGIASLSSDNYIPPNEFLYMGGNGLAYNTTPLRGYDDRTIGPQTNGNPTGGRVLLKYGVELRYALSLDPIPTYLILFGEAGNVWGRFKEFNPFDLKRSIGAGVRLILPAVGLLGFDLGYGFDRKVVDGEDPKVLFHFQFGRGF